MVAESGNKWFGKQLVELDGIERPGVLSCLFKGVQLGIGVSLHLVHVFIALAHVVLFRARYNTDFHCRLG